MKWEKVTADTPDGFYWIKSEENATPLPAHYFAGVFTFAPNRIFNLDDGLTFYWECSPITWPQRTIAPQDLAEKLADDGIIQRMEPASITIGIGAELPEKLAWGPVPTQEPKAEAHWNQTSLHDSWFLRAAMDKLKGQGTQEPPDEVVLNLAKMIAAGKLGNPVAVVQNALGGEILKYFPYDWRSREWQAKGELISPSPEPQDKETTTIKIAGNKEPAWEVVSVPTEKKPTYHDIPLEYRMKAASILAFQSGLDRRQSVHALMGKIEASYFGDPFEVYRRLLSSLSITEPEIALKVNVGMETMEEKPTPTVDPLGFPIPTKTSCPSCRWRPIETAPKDYDIPLLVAGLGLVAIGRYFLAEDKFCPTQVLIREGKNPANPVGQTWKGKITHWQPIPEPPA